jgi:hypothetical protein
MLNFRRGVNGKQSIFAFVRVALYKEKKIIVVTGWGQSTIKALVETVSLVVARLLAKRHIIYNIFSDSAAKRELCSPLSQGFLITHNDSPQSVGIFWTSDQLVAETSN